MTIKQWNVAITKTDIISDVRQRLCPILGQGVTVDRIGLHLDDCLLNDYELAFGVCGFGLRDPSRPISDKMQLSIAPRYVAVNDLCSGSIHLAQAHYDDTWFVFRKRLAKQLGDDDVCRRDLSIDGRVVCCDDLVMDFAFISLELNRDGERNGEREGKERMAADLPVCPRGLQITSLDQLVFHRRLGCSLASEYDAGSKNVPFYGVNATVYLASIKPDQMARVLGICDEKAPCDLPFYLAIKIGLDDNRTDISVNTKFIFVFKICILMYHNVS